MENTTTKFEIIPALLKEMDAEAVTTRKMLALVPDAMHGWQPHDKSMKMSSLAVHLAEIPSWVGMALHTDGMDFATMDFKPTIFANNAELMKIFEGALASGREALAKAKEEDLTGRWTMRTGDKIHAEFTTYETIRHAFAQMIHHRAQLGVYLRLLHIPIPGTYGPSADETGF